MKNKIDKNTVPENFSISLAIVDFVPVVLFCISSAVLGTKMHNIYFVCGSLLCMFSGFVKVLWKIIVAAKKKNIWWMFVQMRILMPIGFMVMLISLFLIKIPVGIFSNITKMPCLLFMILGALGMCLMFVFAFKLDSSDLKSNWIEQITNSIAQACILIGLLLL